MANNNYNTIGNSDGTHATEHTTLTTDREQLRRQLPQLRVFRAQLLRSLHATTEYIADRRAALVATGDISDLEPLDQNSAIRAFTDAALQLQDGAK